MISTGRVGSPSGETGAPRPAARAAERLAAAVLTGWMLAATPPLIAADLSSHHRRALVIGNEKYPEGSLKNPVNDASRVASTLTDLGFAVSLVKDADLKTLSAKIRDFANKLEPDDVALVFYSGHGVDINGENFLLPVDFTAETEDDVPDAAYSVQRLEERISHRRAALTILILDACRDNPFRAFNKGSSKGLADMTAADGVFLAFATKPGGTAADSPQDKNSVFTRYLVEGLSRSGQPLGELFDEVRGNVWEATHHRQRPWTNSNIIGSFYFRPATPSAPSVLSPPPPGAPAPPPRDAESGEHEKGERRNYLGIWTRPYTADYGRQHGFPMLESGLVVTNLVASAPVSKAGLRKGDVIRRADGILIKDVKELGAVLKKAGAQIRLEIWRGSQRLEIKAAMLQGAEQLETACAAGDALGCVFLGSRYEDGVETEKDLPRSFSLYNQSCNLGEPAGCIALADDYAEGAGIYKDLQRAASLRDTACKKGAPAACFALAMQLDAGDGVAKDAARAAALAEKACDLYDFSACSWLGYQTETGDGVARDLARANSLYERACAGRYMTACYNLAFHLASDPGARDLPRAAALYGQACEASALAACNNLAVLYENGGGGISQDRAKAISLYEQACEGANMMSCTNLGHLLVHDPEMTRDPLPRAASLFERACGKDDGRACRELGNLYDQGKGVAKDPAKAISLFERSCKLKYLSGCTSLAVSLETGANSERDMPRAVTLITEACDKGELVACSLLGAQHEAGLGMTKDLPLAASLYERACSGGVLLACDNLGTLRTEGEGVPQERAKERLELFEKACTGGVMTGCYHLASELASDKGAAHDPARAATLFQQACDGGVADACKRLGPENRTP